MSYIKLPIEDYPYGICPLMSTGHVVPVKPKVEIEGAPRFAQSPILVPCLGAQCQLWGRGRLSEREFVGCASRYPLKRTASENDTE
jgi:hypothetical protein